MVEEVIRVLTDRVHATRRGQILIIPHIEELFGRKHGLHVFQSEHFRGNIENAGVSGHIVNTKRCGQCVNIHGRMNFGRGEKNQVIPRNNRWHVCSIVFRPRLDRQLVNHGAHVFQQLSRRRLGVRVERHSRHMHFPVAAHVRVFREQIAHRQKLVIIVRRDGGLHDFGVQHRQSTVGVFKRLTHLRLVNGNRIPVFAVYGMEHGLNGSLIRAVNIVAQIFVIRVIDVGVHHADGNFLLRRPVLHGGTLEFGQRVLPPQFINTTVADLIHESIIEFVAHALVAHERLQRVMHGRLGCCGNTPLELGRRFVPNKIDNISVSALYERPHRFAVLTCSHYVSYNCG